MEHNKMLLLVAFVTIATLLLSACQPQTIIQAVEATKGVVKVVKETQVTEKAVEKTQFVAVECTVFTTPHPILGNLKVRRAIAYCTNKTELVLAGYPLLSKKEAQKLVMDTMIPKTHWAYAGDENVTIYPFDPEKGKALLEEAGWTLGEKETVRAKDGAPLSLKFLTTNAAFSQAWADLWEKQMADCGIQILRSHVPSTWWFGDTTGLQVRDFEIGAYAWAGEADPGGVTRWTCNMIPLPENNWEGQNYMGWCNEAASNATLSANNTLRKEDRIAHYQILQAEYTKDVPAIPLFNRTKTFSTVANLQNFKPTPGEQYYVWNIQEWEVPGRDTLVVGLTQEPASLYPTVESAYVTALAYWLVNPVRAYTSLNYDFQATEQKELSTIESGLAQNNDVEVKEGDVVVDTTGEVVELAAGVKIKDASGAEVEYTGSPVTMKQLVVKYEFRDDLKFSDGEALKQADLELGYKTACDKENGATSFYICDRTKEVAFDGLSYTATYLPGYQYPLYFVAPFGWLPSHRVIESEGEYKGKTLAEVPASAYPTLPEIAENPIGVGPYRIKEWVKGQKIVYEANPYYFRGAPKTKNIVISFIPAENAEAQLLSGQVDLLGSETLASLSEQLVKAEKDGKVKNYIIPDDTWEHIDFNMFLK